MTRIERTLPMKFHKRIVIDWLTAHPEDAPTIVPPEWQDDLQG